MQLGMIISIIFAIGAIISIIAHFHYAKKFKTLPNGPEKDHYHKMGMISLGLVAGHALAIFVSSSTIDERKSYQYPIVDRYDINDQYEYIDVWENPKTKCRYLIHHTRLSTSKPEINYLPSGKPDCPENR